MTIIYARQGPREGQPKKCYFCHKKTTDEFFCYGCGEYVCEECEVVGPMGDHTPEDHKDDDED